MRIFRVAKEILFLRAIEKSRLHVLRSMVLFLEGDVNEPMTLFEKE